jgi:hypothetical protein
MRTTYYYVSLPKLLPFSALWPSEGVGLIERSTESFSRTCRVPPRVRSSRASSEREGPGFQKVGCDCFLECLLPRKEVEIRATSSTRLRARDLYTSRTFIGGKGRAGPSSLLHTNERGVPAVSYELPD